VTRRVPAVDGSRNTWLKAAGYADVYTEHGLDEPVMAQVRHILETLLAAHQPFPAYVVDRAWNLVMANPAATALTGMTAYRHRPSGGRAALAPALRRSSLGTERGNG